MVYQCYGQNCINSHYVFLVGAGVSAAVYHFVKENLKQEPEVEFPIIQENKLVKIRSLLYATLYKSLIKSFGPTLCYAVSYWLLGGFINKRLARWYDIEQDDNLNSFFSIACNLRLLFYTWILSSQILSNMHLMQKFFSILLAEEMCFVIDKNPVVTQEDGQQEITLVDALSMQQVPVIQSLAALDLYTIGLNPLKARRQSIFSLSVPGMLKGISKYLSFA